MRIGLINPNRLRQPPVLPIGLEYVAGALRQAGHDVRVLDLCFVNDPAAEIGRFVREHRPQAAFLTIRNVDSVINAEERFFLEEHRQIAALLANEGLPLVVGGAGVVAAPKFVRDYLGARTAVVGPGERAAVAIAEAMANGADLPELVDGFALPFDPRLAVDRAVDLDYATYYARDGIAGFTSSYGCPGACAFCIEARTPVRLRDPAVVREEVRSLVERGWSRMHLCDAELNVSYRHALAVCEALAGTGARWATYLRHRPLDPRLSAALREAGCDMATVTVTSATDRPDDAGQAIRRLRQAGIRVAVDLSCGLPGERPEQAREMIRTLHEAGAQRVGVTVRFRVYPNTRLAHAIRRDPAERRWTHGDPEFSRPAAYCRFDPAEVCEWIAGMAEFAIDTGEAVNYQRLQAE